MSIMAHKGKCWHCGHDHDRDNFLDWKKSNDEIRFEALPRFIAAICWKSDLPVLGHLKHGFILDELRVWIDEAIEKEKST